VKNDFLPNILKDKLIEIDQCPEMKQLLSGRGKNIQMPIWVNVIGDDAIRKATLHSESLRENLLFVLKGLDPPRFKNLIKLAIQLAIESFDSKKAVGEFLGITERNIYYWIKTHGSEGPPELPGET